MEKIKKITKRSRGGGKIPLRLRFEILKRDNSKCIMCGRSPPEVTVHVDHIISFSKGGKTIASNLRVLCSDCNLGKSNK
jgi:5-methylcytosine-specific restriction endonuclease McrA